MGPLLPCRKEFHPPAERREAPGPYQTGRPGLSEARSQRQNAQGQQNPSVGPVPHLPVLPPGVPGRMAVEPVRKRPHSRHDLAAFLLQALLQQLDGLLIKSGVTVAAHLKNKPHFSPPRYCFINCASAAGIPSASVR